MALRPRLVSLLAPLLVLGVSLATGVAAARAGDPRPPAAAGEQDRSVGEDLWRRDCAVCHGEGGDGSDRGPSLQGVGAAGVDLAVRTGRMPISDPGERAARGPVTYDPAELTALVEYVGSIVDGPGVPEIDPAEADVAAGGSVFREQCASCHQMAGQGGVLTGGRNVPALEAADELEVVEAIRAGPNDMPPFSDAVVSADEAVDVAAYVLELQEPTDRGGWSLGHWGPVPEGAVALVFGLVPIVVVCRLLGDRSDDAGGAS